MPMPTAPVLADIRNLVLDMDGVLWHGNTPMPGLAAFFATLDELGMAYILATNNATRSVEDYVAKLAGFGVRVPAERILTSGLATAAHLRARYDAGTPVYVVGEPALHQFMLMAGFDVINGEPDLVQAMSRHAELVVAGLHRKVCYHELAAATLHINRGATFYGTNPDSSLPNELGFLPGAGAILAALETATGVPPIIVGKPGPIVFDEALRRLGAPREATAMVGDRLGTDIVGGQNAGLRTILVLSGVSAAGEPDPGVQPDFTFADIGALAAALRAAREG